MLDPAMILFDAVIEVSALPDTDWLEQMPRSVLQPAFTVTFDDGFPVCLAAVDNNAFWSAVTCKRFAYKSLGSNQIAVFAEEEFDRVAYTVDCPVQIHPLPVTTRLRRLKRSSSFGEK